MKKLINIYDLYKDGFMNLTIGKTLWKIIFIKLIIILGFLNFFIYDNNFKKEYTTENEKIDFVLQNLIKE